MVLTFTAPEALKILQGAEQQGLIDKVKWACATPCNDASISQALGPAWNDKLGINAELNLVDTTGPDTAELPRRAEEVRAGRGHRLVQPDGLRVGDDRHARRCSDIKGDVTQKSVNEAFKDIEGLRDRHPLQAVVLGR